MREATPTSFDDPENIARAAAPRDAVVSRRHVPALDGVRGLAILLVLWEHFTPPLLPGARGGAMAALHNLLNAGWAGVDLFFVLSGFLITGILVDAKPAAGGAAGYFLNFYARRALRIFPLYYLSLAAVAGVTAWCGEPEQTYLWHAWRPWLLCFAGNLFNARHGWLRGPHGLQLDHFWSLAVEEQFYLAWPLLVYTCRPRTLRVACLVAVPLAVALRFYLIASNGNNYAATLLTPCRVDAFAAGALVALWVRRHDPARAARLGRAGAGLMLATGLLLVPTFCDFRWMDVVGRTLLAAFFAGLILAALYTRVGRVFEGRLLRALGKYSYGAYVLHFLLYRSLDRLFPLERLGVVPRFVCCAGASFALAWCSWHLVEKHFLRLKERFPLQRMRYEISRRAAEYAEKGGKSRKKRQEEQSRNLVFSAPSAALREIP